MWQRLGLVLAFVAGLHATSARAEWLAVTSRHFVLYGDASEASLRKQAIALERLDWGLRHFMTVGDPPDAASNKVAVYETSDVAALCRCKNVAGFYVARVSGSIAFVGRAFDDARVVLFHEYAHHFLLGSYSIAFPTWYVEGFAEFASTMRITEEDATIGIAADHRAYGLFNGERLTVEQMFDPATWGKLKRDAFDAFYGRGWLLTHYLTFNQTRFAQFRRYVAALNEGRPGLEAAREAFGDLKLLQRELSAYLAKNRIPGMAMKFAEMPPPQVTVRRLSDGEAAMIRLRMESTRGVDRTTAAPLFTRAAPIAARYPDDAVVQGWFAEIAYDAGEDVAAAKAADRAVALDAKSVQGLLYQARVRLRALVMKKDAVSADWITARKPIIAANRLDPDDAEPLWLFWQSMAMEGRAPSKATKIGLYRAQELVPQDSDVRFAAAASHIMDGERDEARRLLRPLAYSPHAPADNPATKMLAALDAGKPAAEVMAAGASPAAP